MSNGIGGGPPNPPEKLEVTCVFKSADVAVFEGQETEPEQGSVILTLDGATRYFTQGGKYVITFDPRPADHVPAG